jgi:hypothetical protein
MKSRKELLERQKQLQSVFPEAQRQLMEYPGVTKVGIGIKETDGQLTGETVFRVYVLEKLSPDELAPSERIPKEIFGFKTDVVIVRPEEPEDDDSRYRPVKPGCQINRQDSGEVGTLGLFAHLVADDTIMLVSNHHVIYGSNNSDGSEVGQPNHSTSCCCTCGDIAVNVHGIKKNHLDVGIARLKTGVIRDDRIKQIGMITGIADAVAGEAVKKRGRTTELTNGNVTNLTMDSGGTKILEIEVKTDNGMERFSRGGDSGSALLNADNEIIGLHKSGNNKDDVTPGNFLSTSIGIQEVLDALDTDGFAITIITGTGDDESASFSPSVEVAEPDLLTTFEHRLKQTDAGRELWEAIRRNHQEVLRLINEERPVTVAWRRKQGPAFVAAVVRSTKVPEYQIPTEIEGISRSDLALAMLNVLKAHGSARLRADLRAHADLLKEALNQGMSVEELITAWEKIEANLVTR